MAAPNSGLEKYKSQAFRLRTFITREPNDRAQAIPMVVAGFIQETIGTKQASGQYWCPWCDLRLRDFDEDDNPIVWHHVFSGNCPFLTKNNEIDIADLGLDFPTLDLTTEHAKFLSASEKLNKPIHRKRVVGDQEVRKLYRKLNKLGKIVPANHWKVMDEPDKSLDRYFDLLNCERTRRQTFVGFEQEHIINAKSLSAAGFFRLLPRGLAEEYEIHRSRCLFCGHAEFRTLEGLDTTQVNNGYDFHRRYGAEEESCPLISGGTCMNIPDLMDDLYREEVKGVVDEELKERFNLFEHPVDEIKYGGAETRSASFKLWPSQNCKTKEEMIEYELYYTLKDDIVKCFYCSETFTGYKAEDDLWEIHASKSPDCIVVKRNKSSKFIKSAKVAQANKRKVVRDFAQYEIEMRVSTPAARVVFEMFDPTFEEADIREQIAKNYCEGGGDYETATQIVKEMLKTKEEYLKEQKENEPLTDHIPTVVTYPRPELFVEEPEEEEEEASKEFTAPTKPVWGENVDEQENLDADESLDDIACMLCLENIRSTILLPCGDSVCCLDCAFGTKKCPQCRQLVTGVTICEVSKL